MVLTNRDQAVMDGTLWSLYQRQTPRFQLTRGMALSLLIHAVVVVLTVVVPSFQPKRSLPEPFYTVDLVSLDQAGISASDGPGPGANGQAAAPKAAPSKGHAPIPVMPVGRLRAQSVSTPVTPLKKLDSTVEPERTPKTGSGLIDKTLDKLIPKPKQEKEPPPAKTQQDDKKVSGSAASQAQPDDTGKSAKTSERKDDAGGVPGTASQARGDKGPGTPGGGSGSGGTGTGSGGTGSPSGGTGAAAGGDPGQIGLARRLYYAEVWNIIRREWTLDTSRLKGQRLEAIIVLVVRRDGKILSHHFEKKSGNALLDESAERAVRKVDSLPPFPKIYSPPQEEIGIRFRPEDLA
jgi:colicin import membrane protein